MSLLITGHAIGASLALLLGGVNVVRRPKGDRVHRRIGLVWVVAMYWTVLSSFFIHEVNPGGFSWLHGLSAFTFITLTLGLVGAISGRIEQHKRNMTGSWFGTIGAFIGATVVPQRAVPQLAVHHPWVLSLAAFGVLGTAYGIVAIARRVPARTHDGASVVTLDGVAARR